MRVGTSNPYFSQIVPAKDHPHACGDKALAGQATKADTGSSPCVWGQVNLDMENAQINGIIPMRVGTSLSHLLLRLL